MVVNDPAVCARGSMTLRRAKAAFMFSPLRQLLNKMLQDGVFVVLAPCDEDLLRFALAGQGDEDHVFGADIPGMGVLRHDGDALLRRHHHQDALHVVGAQQNLRLIARLLVKADVERVTEGIAGTGGRHEKDVLLLEVK